MQKVQLANGQIGYLTGNSVGDKKEVHIINGPTVYFSNSLIQPVEDESEHSFEVAQVSAIDRLRELDADIALIGIETGTRSAPCGKVIYATEQKERLMQLRNQLAIEAEAEIIKKWIGDD